MEGRLTDSSRNAGFGTPGEREGIDRDSQLLGLPRGSRDAALVLLAVRDQRDARHHAGGQRSDGLANRGFQIGGAAGFARGRSEFEIALLLAEVRSRVERANGTTRIQ